MPIQLTGSLDISGSILLNGTAVTASGGGGSVPASVETGGNLAFNAFGGFASPTYIYDVASSAIVDVHISQSGVYLISGSFATTESGSVNLYYYPDDLAVGDNAVVWFTCLGTSGATGTRITYQGIISGSANSRYFVKNSTIFGTTSNIQSGASSTQNTVLYRAGAAAVTPVCIYKASSSGSMVYNINDLTTTSPFQTLSGSYGTPIV